MESSFKKARVKLHNSKNEGRFTIRDQNRGKNTKFPIYNQDTHNLIVKEKEELIH